MGEILNSALVLLLAPLAWLISWAVWIVGAAKSLTRKARPAPNCVLITGATSGIGEALAARYAGPGVTIAITGRQSDALQRTTEACVARGARVLAKRLDVTDAAGLAAWIREVDAAAPLELVIANAGVTERTTKTEDDLEAAARAVFAANIDGVVNTIFPALACMRARAGAGGRGQIALMASLASFGALTGSAAYCASKAAVRVYGDGLRATLAREGISVCTICPGYVATPMTALNKFSQPMKMTTAQAVEAIVHGLAYDHAHIAFPGPLYALTATLGALPSVVRHTLGAYRLLPQIAYLRKSSKVAAPAGAGAAAAADAPAAAVPAVDADAAAGGTGSTLRRKRTGL